MTAVNYIAGRWVTAESERTLVDTNPADTRDVLARFPSAGLAELEAALAAAQQAFASWRRLPFPQRLEPVARAGGLMRERRELLAELLTRENGKTLRESRGEVDSALAEMDFQMHQAERLWGRVAPARRAGVYAYTLREPRGVVAAICPWNFPLNVPGRKIIPALVSGNTVVFKPASLTPLIGMEFVRLFDEAGLPPGVLNLVVGGGGEIGDRLVSDARVKAISFTGSTEVGMGIHQMAAANLTPTQLELGGKNPAVVLRDADLDLAVTDCLTAGYACAGQWCTSTSRILVEAAVAEEFTERLVAAAARLRVGPGTDDSTDMGPVASLSQVQRAAEYTEIGRREGARLLCGGRRLTEGALEHGYFYEPTVFDRVEPPMRLAQEEVFGPVVACLQVADLAAALQVANAVPFGLSASVYTRDLGRAQRFIEGIEAGLVHVNVHTAYKEPQLCFGGRKYSGAGLPEAGDSGVEFFTQHKAVYSYAGAD